MRSEFLLIPAAIIAATPVHAETFLTVEEAQARLFPGAKMTPADFTMSETQIEQLIATASTTVFRSKVKVWRASTGGWFFVDQVPGRDDRVTYALALDERGGVRGIEMLICLPQYGAVRTEEWRAHFTGRSHGIGGDLETDIPIVSGQTLTTAHVTEGVKRLLATYALFMAKAG